MRKCVVCLLAVVAGFCVTAAFAAEATPIKLSLIPSVAVPASQTVHGLDLGILGTNVDEVQGLQLGWIYCGTKAKMVGLQSGFIDMGNEVTGLQWGFYNQAESMTGLQLGFINSAGSLKGVQLGLVNIIKKGGALPFMVLINAGF